MSTFLLFQVSQLTVLRQADLILDTRHLEKEKKKNFFLIFHIKNTRGIITEL